MILLGGEPVISSNLSIFEEYIGILKQTMRINEIRCITNGLEITTYYAFLQNLGVTKYQVTLDGCRETHNKRRPAKNFKIDSFDTICNSIQLLLNNREDLEIRINIDKDNIHDISAIVSLIINKGWYKNLGKCLKVYIYPISENGVCSNVCYSDEA